MSLHKSFSAKSGTGRHRNVLSRAERIARLAEEERWPDGRSVFGLPKVRSIKPKKKAKAAKETTAEGAAAEAPKAPGEAAKAPAAAPAAADKGKKAAPAADKGKK